MPRRKNTETQAFDPPKRKAGRPPKADFLEAKVADLRIQLSRAEARASAYRRAFQSLMEVET